MKFRALVLLSGFCLGLLIGCGREEASTPLVYGGSKVTNGPISKSIVSLRIGKRMYCSAALIANDIAITAGHCVPRYALSGKDKETRAERAQRVSREESAAVVAFGSNAESATTPTRPIVGWEVSKGWQEFVKTYWSVQETLASDRALSEAQVTWLFSVDERDWGDIALLRFSGGMVPGYVPAQLSSQSPLTGQQISVAGFGMTNVGTNDNGVLRSAVTEVEKIRGREFIAEGEMGRGICKGDSGGPAFSVTNGVITIFGVTSRSTKSRVCQTADHIFTDVALHRHWIQNAIAHLRSL